MAAVTAPVADYNGEVAGVTFVHGKAETDNDNALAYFRRHGYRVDEGDLSIVDDASGPFDPAEHGVDEVNDHLAAADQDERERVLQAESEGKARRGILQGPHADLSGQA